jgi:hypothetical protein
VQILSVNLNISTLSEQNQRDARIDPSTLRSIERAVEELGIGYRVEQLS